MYIIDINTFKMPHKKWSKVLPELKNSNEKITVKNNSNNLRQDSSFTNLLILIVSVRLNLSHNLKLNFLSNYGLNHTHCGA